MMTNVVRIDKIVEVVNNPGCVIRDVSTQSPGDTHTIQDFSIMGMSLCRYVALGIQRLKSKVTLALHTSLMS